MLLLGLSPELLLTILEYVPLQCLANLLVTSKGWHEVIKANEATVYRHAAILHGYVRAWQTFEKAVAQQGSDWLKSVQGWKELCKKYVILDRRWKGKEVEPPPIERKIGSGGAQHHSHRIKIDEEERTVLSTSKWGGLVVRCSESEEILWGLTKAYVKPFSHLEYSNGMMIFGGANDTFEVWVRKSKLPELGTSSRPHLSQEPVQQLSNTSSTSRGVYLPFSLLQNPTPVRAFRFIFPFLLVASQEDYSVNIWHIPSHSIVESFSLKEVQATQPNGNEDGEDEMPSITYVELGMNHIFVCFITKMVIYERGRVQSASAISAASSFHAFKPGRRIFELPRDCYHEGVPRQPVGRGSLYPRRVTMRSSPILTERGVSFTPETSGFTGFTAVHISPDGRDLVAISFEGLLYYVRGFADFNSTLTNDSKNGEGSLKSRAWILHVGRPLRNLAFDGTRIVFDSLDIEDFKGVHVIVLDHDSGSESFPSSSIHHISSTPSVDVGISCLQMTRTSVWYACGVMWRPTIASSVPQIVHVDFA